MATTWTVRPQTDDRRWLLTNGEIVKAPALEETPSGRKVRVVGTEIDGYARDIDSVIRGGLDAAAKSRGASVWMPIHDDTNWYFKRALGVDLEADLPRASIHLLGRSQSVGEQTVFWWRFKHPEYPIQAIVSIIAKTTGRADVSGLKFITMATKITYQVTKIGPGAGTVASSIQPNFYEFSGSLSYLHEGAWAEFLRDNPTSLSPLLTGETATASEKQAVEWMLGKLRAVEELDEVEIPDGRDLDQPGYLTLELNDTNVTGEALDLLIQYLDGAPTIEQAAEHYRLMVEALRHAGVVLGDKTEGDFLSALVSGEGLTVSITPYGPGQMRDLDHTVKVDMVTGTFTVVCSHDIDHHNTPDHWQKAVTIASLTGKEDELLAYARAEARQRTSVLADEIIEERRRA
jgi:hypothetical protein